MIIVLSAFGLDDFTGECELGYDNIDQCEKCWDRALIINKDIKTYYCEQDCIYIRYGKLPCVNKKIINLKNIEKINIVYDNNKYSLCPYYIEENK